MTTEIRLGKIKEVSFGLGGYQEACLGLHLTFSGQSWGVGSSKSFWDYELIKHSEHCKWTEESRDGQAVEVMQFISTLLQKAKVTEISQLKGKPVECTFEGMTLKSWRILEEVL